ncbi:restriction endonuclease subunit S [Salmonella enterica]|uniref:Restriction endonuclease n=1 Tax=Salmonella enterica I TaxID=59201 RepID=A0A3V9WKR6_SALET|nr:restriction endonuclease subunit S [Salmonella enterica]EAA9529823.1 restriction endonuclease subunit S [Salmonella enterica subsp. enterica serovar Vitkin]EBR0199024.1 restriction endonuclease subunit S [Salmonella enterica subsp. enterica serovar Bonn]EBZ1660035.1 restriction endonuclease subunit S [Salmonella enterica subsp. enterica serovar Emek]ECA2007618.1 restriction endonuclease subunit S [Salmonella enterica subsp. enterica serovar Newport]ECH8925926.1 restriction endonuclease subu
MAVEKLIVDHIDTWTTALQTRSTAGRGSSGKIELYGIKKLRELILELAVRGKLVPQDPNDEPASELLKHIAAEKAELVKQGKIKKPKPLPEISEEEKPFELPVGWEWVRLDMIANIFNGNSISTTEKESKYIQHTGRAFIATKDVGYGFEKLNYENGVKIPFDIDKFKVAKKNSVLICAEGGSAGKKCGITNQEICFGNKLFANECYSGITPLYILTVFLSPSFFAQFEKSVTGIIGGISTAKFKELLIPVAPHLVQTRIACKITELMVLCDQLEQQSLTSLDAHQQLVETLLTTLTDSQNAEELAENWARISEHFDTLFTTETSIDALKQTILQLAVMGKLVPQDPNDEPASELLKRIAQEKAQLVKDGKMKKQKQLPPISDGEKPFELPDGWEWCRLTDIGELARGKSKHRPRNDPALYTNGEYPLVQTGDVARSGGCIRTFSAMYNKVGLNQSRLWPKGTLCITIAANIADSGILEFDACFPDSVVGFTPYDKEIPVIYFHYFMITIKSSLEKFAPSTAQKNINLDVLSQVFVPCPPLKEFLRIVGKTRMLLKQCEQIKSCFKSAQQTQLHLADALTDAAIN